MTKNPIISIENLSFSYNGETVLDNVNLSINENDFVWIVGPNGGGKTTLLKLILGLQQPAKGTVRVFEQPPDRVRPHIGYMTQHVSLDAQFPVTVTDVVLMGRLGNGGRYGPYRTSDKEAVERALRQVNLYDLRYRPYSALSGGQQRRLLIARALASQPKILLLDEPTANLDIQAEKELFELLKILNHELTIIMVSHDPAFVSDFVKRVVCVNRIVHEHPTSEISGLHIGEFLGEDRRIVRHDRHLDGAKSDD